MGEKDYCTDCGAEFEDYHHCEYVRVLEEESLDQED